MATENKSSILYEEDCKVEKISDHIGCVYSGMGPDYRLLVRKARKLAMEYELQYGEEIPTIQLVTKLAAVMQEYTQSGLVHLNTHHFSCYTLSLKRGATFRCLDADSRVGRRQ